VHHTGVKELRAFVQGLLKDAPAARAGLWLIESYGPTEASSRRLKWHRRQAYAQALVVKRTPSTFIENGADPQNYDAV
jgi:hypothetical protein